MSKSSKDYLSEKSSQPSVMMNSAGDESERVGGSSEQCASDHSVDSVEITKKLDKYFSKNCQVTFPLEKLYKKSHGRLLFNYATVKRVQKLSPD